MDPRDRMIVALDVDGAARADALVEGLGDSVTFYKVGYQLAFSAGLGYVRDLAMAGKKVFLDLKLHDIGNTVQRGTEAIAALGATFLTVHAYPQTMRAAADGAKGSTLKVLGVTLLTSYDSADLAEAGYAENAQALVARRAGQALEAGLDGLILSPEELPAIRARFGGRLTLVTPGVRPSGSAADDQKRIATPTTALQSGADHLVIGRPITAAPDPKAAAEAILAEIERALQPR
jgi:orotidine-5'-phosphate decarboxylase